MHNFPLRHQHTVTSKKYKVLEICSYFIMIDILCNVNSIQSTHADISVNIWGEAGSNIFCSVECCCLPTMNLFDHRDSDKVQVLTMYGFSKYLTFLPVFMGLGTQTAECGGI